MEILRLTLVYNADWTGLGMLRYALRMATGGQTCPLCDITHGGVREKSAWRGCVSRLGLPVDVLYRNQLKDAGVRSAVEGELPCVLAQTLNGWSQLVSAEMLSACSGSVGALQERLYAQAKEHRLTFPNPA